MLTTSVHAGRATSSCSLAALIVSILRVALHVPLGSRWHACLVFRLARWVNLFGYAPRAQRPLHSPMLQLCFRPLSARLVPPCVVRNLAVGWTCSLVCLVGCHRAWCASSQWNSGCFGRGCRWRNSYVSIDSDSLACRACTCFNPLGRVRPLRRCHLQRCIVRGGCLRYAHFEGVFRSQCSAAS